MALKWLQCTARRVCSSSERAQLNATRQIRVASAEDDDRPTAAERLHSAKHDLLISMLSMPAKTRRTASLYVGRLFRSRVSELEQGLWPVTHHNESGLIRRDNLPTCEDVVEPVGE